MTRVERLWNQFRIQFDKTSGMNCFLRRRPASLFMTSKQVVGLQCAVQKAAADDADFVFIVRLSDAEATEISLVPSLCLLMRDRHWMSPLAVFMTAR